MIVWQTEFVAASGQLFGLEIHTDAEGATALTGRWADLTGEEPVLVETDAVTPVKDRIQSSRAKVSVLVRNDTELLRLYAMAESSPRAVRLLIKRNGVPVWGGYMDAEGVEIPQDWQTAHVVSLSFGDFEPLKLVKYAPEGIITVTEALARTVAGLGTPLKTDGAYIIGSPQTMAVDTNLLGSDATLYDLLDLVCAATVTTVRQWGVVRFDNPIQVRNTAPTDLSKLYGDRNVLRRGRIYNTINYSLEVPKGDDKSKGEVVTISDAPLTNTPTTYKQYNNFWARLFKGVGRYTTKTRPINHRGVYAYTDDPKDKDHTFFDLERAFGWAHEDLDYGTEAMQYAVPLIYFPVDGYDFVKTKPTGNGSPIAAVSIDKIDTFGQAFHISAPLRLLFPFSDDPKENTTPMMFYLSAPCGLYVTDPSGNIRSWDGAKWVSGSAAHFYISWRSAGLTGSFEDCTTLMSDVNRYIKQADGNWPDTAGIDIPLPANLPQGSVALLRIFNGIKFSQYDKELGDMDEFFAEMWALSLIQYIGDCYDEPGGYLLESLSLTQGDKTGRE